MRYLFYTAVFLFLSLVLVAQKKPFFDKIDMTWNIHILNDNNNIEKDKWSELFKGVNLNYPINSLRYAERIRPKCGTFLPPISLSGGIRIAKDLFSKSEGRLLKDRVEWRSGLLVGSKLRTSTYLTDRNYFQAPVQVPYRYRDVILTYRRFWIDYSNQVVYKIPSWLIKNSLKYYIGAGIGFTYEANSRVSENYVQNLITQSGNAYIVTEEVNTTKNEKAKTITSTYINAVCGSEIKCSERVYLLFEANYQGYINSFSLRKRLYKEGGYLSLIFRYSF